MPLQRVPMLDCMCAQDFAAAFSKLLELGVPYPEGAPAAA